MLIVLRILNIHFGLLCCVCVLISLQIMALFMVFSLSIGPGFIFILVVNF